MKKNAYIKPLSALLVIGLIVYATFASDAFADALIAKVDRQHIAEDETLNLRVTFQGNNKTDEKPDFSLLMQNFDILSNSQNSRMEYVNGTVNASTEWLLTLGPQHVGKLLIPSFNLNGQVSDAIEINVKKTTASVNQVSELRIETILDKPSAYVQEQIKLTQRLIYSARLQIDSLEAEPLKIDNAIIEQLPDNNYSKKIGGQTYYVYEYNYAILPQASGVLKIPSLRWNVRIAQGGTRRSLFDNFGRTQLKRKRTEEKTLPIKPKPSAFPDNALWLPAKKLSIAESWSKDPSQFSLGEPITRQVQIIGEGVSSAQLPTILQSGQSNNIKIYADKPQLEQEAQPDGLVAKRTDSAAIVISAPGHSTLPEIRIPWWNTETDTLQYLTVDAVNVNLAGAPATTSNTQSQTLTQKPPTTTHPAQPTLAPTTIPAAQGVTSSPFWQRISLILALIALLFAASIIVLWLRLRALQNMLKTGTNNTDSNSTSIPLTNEKQTWKQLQSALTQGDYATTCKLLPLWFDALVPEKVTHIRQIPSLLQQQLQALEKHYQHQAQALPADINNRFTALLASLHQLDQGLYAKEAIDLSSDSLLQLAQCLKQFREMYNKQKLNTADANSGKLSELYPNTTTR